jgi:hypothetical protein
MTNPGIYDLGDLSITAADTYTTEWTDQLDGVSAASLQVRLAYGSGGATIKVYVQTSLDQGTTPIDIACLTFATASGVKLVNLSGLTPKTTAVAPSDGALTDDTCLDGTLGDRLRVKVVSTGIYAGSTILSTRAAAR